MKLVSVAEGLCRVGQSAGAAPSKAAKIRGGAALRLTHPTSEKQVGNSVLSVACGRNNNQEGGRVVIASSVAWSFGDLHRPVSRAARASWPMRERREE